MIEITQQKNESMRGETKTTLARKVMIDQLNQVVEKSKAVKETRISEQ